jgi:hypothetical protein
MPVIRTGHSHRSSFPRIPGSPLSIVSAPEAPPWPGSATVAILNRADYATFVRETSDETKPPFGFDLQSIDETKPPFRIE